jgi:hypothetical protein
MAKFAQCDCCPTKDDWSYEAGKPILDGGVIIQFRSEGNDDFERTVDLCLHCRKKLESFLSSLTTQNKKETK